MGTGLWKESLVKMDIWLMVLIIVIASPIWVVPAIMCLMFLWMFIIMAIGIPVGIIKGLIEGLLGK